MDIRNMMAQEIAQQIGADVLSQRCDRKVAPRQICGWPLMEKPEQGLPFCWGCVTDKRTAFEGRQLLVKARLASQGIVVEEYRQCPPVRSDDDDDDGRPWPEGMPL